MGWKENACIEDATFGSVQMKLAIAVNHSWPHCGGSETVVKQVSEGLTEKYGFECIVISTTTKNEFANNGVKYLPCPNNHLDFYKQINGCDHLLIYSDLFVHWPRIMHDLSKTPCPVTLAPVGMNGGIKKSNVMGNLKRQHEKLRFICHTKEYHDHVVLREIGANVHIIPNAIDLDEFDNCEHIDVFKKYTIDKDKINVLNVSNFFPDKGQDIIPNALVGQGKQFNITFIASSTNINISKQLKDRTMKSCESYMDAKILEDLPRKEIINFFKQADVFAFPSLIESFGIVPMESMAAGTPWVAYPVGNMKNFKGGKLVDEGFSAGANGKINPVSSISFRDKLFDISFNKELNKQLGKEGRLQIEEEYNLKTVIPKYKEVICGG